METDQPLPAFRIVHLMNRTFGPSIPTGQYVLVVNWDPQDPTFTLKDKSLKDGEFGRHCYSWIAAYMAALDAIEKIEKLYHRKALLRGLTPVPLHLLNAEVQEWDAELAGTGLGAAYSWQFLGDRSGEFNVVVNEKDGFFQGIHDNR